MKKIINELIERELKYGDKKDLFHCNCAEILLMSANEKYSLKLDDKTIKAVTPFGGGIYSERTCGALCGSVAAIGVLFAENKPTSNKIMKEKTKELVKSFEEEFGSLECSYIKKHHRSTTEGCKYVEIKAGEILEKIIESDKKE